MFTTSELTSIDKNYFEVISSSAMSCTLRSKCTGHFWHLLYRENRIDGYLLKSCELYHRRNTLNGYHFQKRFGSFSDAISEIRSHDAYFLNKEKSRKEEIKKRRAERNRHDKSHALYD